MFFLKIISNIFQKIFRDISVLFLSFIIIFFISFHNGISGGEGVDVFRFFRSH